MSLQFPDYGILYIDDEQKSLKYFEAIFDQIAPIYTADSPAKGFELFVENHERIGLVLCDKKMPQESGIDLLRRIEKHDPRPLRFLMTAYVDLSVAVESLNEGLLYSYLSKPWDPTELEHRLIKALNHFCLAREREQLIQEKCEALEHLRMSDKVASMGILSAGLNHHLRNALTVLRTFYDMLPYQLREELGGEPEDSSFWTEFYGEVGGQMDRMTSMLSQLTEGTERGKANAHDPIDIESVLRSSGEIVLQDCPDISFSLTKEDETLPTILGDSPKISQMIRLLLQEARSNIHEKGAVEVKLAKKAREEGVVITLIDDSKPLPEAELKHLFDPFFVRSEKPEELGTHLLACYLTVFHHGGSIRAYRYNDGRNAIEISLPLEAREVSRESFSGDRFGSPEIVSKASDTILPG